MTILSNTQLHRPEYHLPDADLRFFKEDLEAQLQGIDRSPKVIQERRRLLGYHGETATEMLLKQSLPDRKVENMNQISKNYPGFDFLIDGKVRVQCKGRCWVELVDFALKPLDSVANWNSDIWITIDFSGFLDGRIGRLKGEATLAPINRARWYVAPTHELKEFVRTKCAHMTRIRAQAWRTSVANKKANHFPELLAYEDAFHWITAAL